MHPLMNRFRIAILLATAMTLAACGGGEVEDTTIAEC